MVERCEHCKKTFKIFKQEEKEETMKDEGITYNVNFIVYSCPKCGNNCYTVLKDYQEVYKEVVKSENTSIT